MTMTTKRADVLGRRKPSYITTSRHQEKRRIEFIQRSKQARSDALAKARGLAPRREESSPETSSQADVELETTGEPAETSAKKILRHYANMFMPLEWLIEIPATIGPTWRVIARPEGKRCLLFASGGRTVSRQKSGGVLHSFQSVLPNGSRNTRRPGTVFSILDSVFHEADATYYVLDVLAWNGVHLCGASTDCRINWMRSHLLHLDSFDSSEGHCFRLRPCDMHACNTEGFQEAYAGDVPFQRDGLLIIHKDSPYVMESNPYALQWKDSRCSRWAIDTDKDGNPVPQQEVVLAYQANGDVMTGDKPKGISLGRMPAVVMEKMGHKLKPGLLLRFKVGDGGFYLGLDGMPVGADLHWLGVANQRRAAADLYSRLVFQWQLRTHGTTVDALATALQEGTENKVDGSLDMCDDGSGVI